MWDRDEQASPPRLVHSIFLNWAILLAMRVLTDWFDSVVSCEISKSYLHSLHCCVFFPLSWDTVSESVHSSLKDVLRKWGHLGFPSKQFHSSGNPLLLYEPPPPITRYDYPISIIHFHIIRMFSGKWGWAGDGMRGESLWQIENILFKSGLCFKCVFVIQLFEIQFVLSHTRNVINGFSQRLFNP